MKKLFYTFFLLVGVGLFAEAEIEKKEVNATAPTAEKVEVVAPKEEVKKVVSATRGDIKVIEASENIRYLSQKMVKIIFSFTRIKINRK